MRVEHLSEFEIQEFVDNAVGAPAENRQHIMVCQHCQESLLDYRLLAAQLSTVSVPDHLSNDFTEKVLEQIATVDHPEVSRRRWYMMSSIGAVAAVVAATGIALLGDFQPLVSGSRDLLAARIAENFQPTFAALRSALTPSQALAYGAAAAACIAAVSLIESALLRPVKARLGR